MEEFYNQPGWTPAMASLALYIHRLDRGDTPSKSGKVGCYAAASTMATAMNVSDRTVFRLLKKLKEAGALVELESEEGSTTCRRINLQYEVRDRIFAKRKIRTVVNGQIVTRKLEKKDLPAPVLRGRGCQGTTDKAVRRISNGSETRNTPIIPLAGDGRIFSDFQTEARNVPTATKPTAPKSNTPPAPKLAKYTRSLRDNPEICVILKDHYPVEQQSDDDLRVLGRRLSKGQITPHTLARALAVKDRLTDYDEDCKVARVLNFRHFLNSFKRLSIKASEGLRNKMWSMLNEAKINLSYPEVRKQLGDEHGLDVDITDGICQSIEDLLFSMLAGGPGTQTDDDVRLLGTMMSGTFLKMKFNELKKEYLEAYPEEALA